ncbi:MAG: ribosome biogenesis GTPase Der [Polyangia bacterium]|nr:ribosome biogenesis GTPase Der [Polyangia bacterium]
MKPVVCIVGRPNVGKSTLFNRLVGSRLAIVQDEPGVTRDRLYGAGDWDGLEFVLVDTGGLTPSIDATLARSILAQARVGIEEADAILFVLDVREGITGEDRDVAALLRQSGKPVLLAANKADGPAAALGASEFYELGLGEVHALSAQHGRNVGELLDDLTAVLRARAAGVEPEDDQSEEAIRVALVGRPNAGKSSLVNQLVKEERMLVDDAPGTTRDPVDSPWEAAGQRFVLVDTAGMRRKRSIALDMEKLAVLKAMRALERTDVACLVLDAGETPSDQDARIAGLAAQNGRAMLLLVNKMDLVPEGSQRWKEQRQAIAERLRFVSWAPVVPVSARSGYGLGALPKALLEAHGQWDRRLSTAVVNRFLEDVVSAHHPAAHQGREVKLYYASQVSSRPPTFVFSVNNPEALQESSRRYLANRLREAFGFEGTPIRLVFRRRRRRGDSEP